MGLRAKPRERRTGKVSCISATGNHTKQVTPEKTQRDRYLSITQTKLDLVDGGLVVAPVLEELRRKLYGVPRDLVYPGEVDVHRGEHVLQTMAELVEKRDDLEQPNASTRKRRNGWSEGPETRSVLWFPLPPRTPMLIRRMKRRTETKTAGNSKSGRVKRGRGRARPGLPLPSCGQ